ncbi:fatty acyl-CoA reductase 1-like [Maniola jurtina]|uniref:fatty acyl-CoA reductase 1-like n=1 Tax=Maniola jurtina TaxID=191418 RepID=UPI001E689D51|nr:fatty acyl-CoA reductase 1-like [Maniola jurtina]XP_045770533.1 fatty acyl-CoA reductase 1-like [Maniola jurtina]XP_045770534.1 fatty acyl-CoA reductase 1-like [Maniola jurtina]
MTYLEDCDLEGMPSIPEYYREKTIFLTGGTGFIGKVLVEKLLYSCPNLDRIYILVRSKKGVKSEDRMSAIYASKCFDRLRKERPGAFESKVFFIEGDCSELGLGLSEEDRAMIVNKTHIIYHAAASVRFDDPMKLSAKLNLRGTREIIELAKDVKHLECFVLVSTSFANTNRDPIEEIMYPPHADWRETLEICENVDDRTLNVLTPKYLGEMPNTYVFNKQLAEHVVYEQKGILPIVIVRPSIVISSIKEPVPGWIENFNGPVGLSIASAKGILRTVYAGSDIIADFIPVDVVVKGFIVASWIRGTKIVKPTDDIPIYNTCNGSMDYSTTFEEIFNISQKVVPSFPLDNMIWSFSVSLCSNKSIYFIKILLLHVLPAILLDILLWMLGRKTMVLKIQRRIYSSNLALQFYTTQQWTFSNENFLSLRSKIKEEDKKHFYYDMENIDKSELMINGIIGGRRYLLNEKDENLPKSRAHFKRITLLDKIVKYLFFGYIIWWIIHTDFVRNIWDDLLQY